MTLENPPASPEPNAAPHPPRQVVRFAFYRVTREWFALPADKAQAARAELADVVRRFGERILLRAYSLVGTKGDTDLMIWQVANRLEELQEFATAVRRTALGRYLEMPVSYLSMTRRSIYQIPGQQAGAGDRVTIAPGAHKYLFVYPFVKSRAWYDLDQAARQEMMNQHIATGRRFPSVTLHTTYSYGLDDQEFVLAFESDSADDFVDLVMELRHTRASQFTLRDTPIFTCVAAPIEAVLDSLGGKTDPAADATAPSAGDAVRVALADLPPGQARQIHVQGQAVLVANVAGRVYAVSDVCTHARGPLSEGRFEGCQVTCPWHHATFDVTTGAPVSGPSRRPLARYDVTQTATHALIAPRPAAPAPSPADAGAEHELPKSQESQLDETDKWLLNELQFNFPIVREPWTEIAARRSLTARGVLDRVARLKRLGVVRQISPIFDTRALGYSSSLVAARVPEERVDEAAAIINRHPGVSHNYKRSHEYNLWFTLAVPPGEKLQDHLDRLAREARVEAIRPMPTLKMFRISVQLDMTRDETELESRPAGSGHKKVEPVALSEFDKDVIRATQGDLLLVERPFEKACADLAIDFPRLQAWMARMQECGVLRRFAGILRHQSAGFTANGMVVWRVPEDRVLEAGEAASQFSQVSHCYQRPTYPDWPYNLFTMVHARSREACQQIASQIAQKLNVQDFKILYSTKEYKKSRIEYFSEPATTTIASS
jgi:chlorite dismutase/DNA-binding Lrp family transcriptional regulator/nitrite reductase/ring-hydroxylating ferredoxin subunit